MADKKFTLQFDFEGNVAPIKAAVEDFKRSLKDVKLPSNLSTSIEKTLSKLNSEMESFEALTKMGFSNLGDTAKAEKSFGKIITLLNQLEVQSKSITGLDPKKFLPQTTIDRVKKLQKAWDGLERETSKKDDLTKKIKAQTEAIEKQREALKELEESRQALAATNQAKGARKGNLVSSQNADKKRRDEVVAEMTSLEGEKGGKSSAKYTALKQELASLGQAIKNADREIDTLSKDIADNQAKIKSYESNISNAANAIQLLEKDLDDLKNSDITPKGLTELRQELAQITNQKIDQIPTDLQELQQVINGLTDEELKEIAKSLNEIRQSASNLPDSAHKGAEGIQDLVDSGKNAAQAANEIENLKNQVLQFFSITNAIQLFKRTVQSALDTVKELDAVMTETAVVTDFTVGDMWEKLPQYSKEASALGASIRDLYSATTLYYQQGLETDAAMGVGIETMKMARIANMDATDATTAMTAALRGFNMEVNELNAERVNDVYSELAAITAADTSQIATAMSKTASIAASANMEFETTSALLAQIIETTQEAPETAGTAMKTIIARFTEVKELFSEGMLTGEDEEGEEININKIDAALRTVGISLKDFLNGTKGIDDIFLELASKWNSLDLATQRYIATTAAGSRQQSRFIAMMSNYDRTMELVTAANNSAGASQEQFDKTLESMEAKLQKLKNAWDQFAMGLANNEILKGAVDVLTGILETINKLTESLSGGNGLVKSIISLMAVIGALKGGGALFNKGLGSIGEGLGIKNKETDKKKQTMPGKSSTEQSQIQGKEDGEAYISAWNRAIMQGQKGGLKAGVKGIFGDEIEAWKEFSKDKQNQLTLDDMFAKQAEITPDWDFEQYEKIRYTFETEGFDAARDKFIELGGSMDIAGGKIKQFTFDLQSTGQVAMAAGGAINLLSNLFEQAGWEDLAKVTQGLGTTIMFLGVAIQTVGLIAPKGFLSISNGVLMIKTSADAAAVSIKTFLLGTVGPALAAIGPILALAAAFAALAAAAYFTSPEYQLKKASEAADEAAEAADKAADSYNNLKSSLESIEGKETALENLAVGTTEWKEAVSELNNEILNLLSIYPELSEFISSDNGVLSISDTGKQFVLDKQYQNKVNAEALNMGEQIDKVRAQKNLDYSNLDRRLIQTEWENVYDENGYVVEVNQVENRELTEQLARDLASGKLEPDSEELSFLDGIEGGYEEFLEFGRSLITSEQAIGVFTDSLMTAAMTNADVSEEFRSQVGGMYTTEMIDQIVQDYETASGLPTEADKQQYADIKGLTYEGKNKFRDAEGNIERVSTKEIKEQLAPVKAQQEMTEAIGEMETVFSTLQNSSDGLEKAFANVISKAEGAGLTLKDLAELEKLDLKNLNTEALSQEGPLKDLYESVSKFYTEDQFIQLLQESVTLGEARKAKVDEKFSTMQMENPFAEATISTGALADIVDNIYSVFLTSGKNISSNLANTLNSNLESIKDPKQAELFAQGLNMIDWSNIDDIETLDQILIDLGFDATAAGVDIEDLEDQIASAAKATKTFDLDKLKEEIKSAQDLVKDIKEREDTERTFTQEERDLMVSANESLASDFVMTGIDEFVYVGDSMGSLVEALNANTSALLSRYGDQIAHDAEMSRKWQDIADSERKWTAKDGTDYGTDYQVLRDIATGEKSASEFNEESLFNLMTQAGIAFNEQEISGNATLIADLIAKSFELYGTEAQRNQIFQAEEEYNSGLDTMQYSIMSGQEILNQQAATPEQKIEAETAKTEALDAKLVLQEGGLQEYEKTLAGLNDEFKNHKNLVKAAIVDSNNYEKKLDKLTKTYKDNEEALSKNNKGTKQYQQAIAKITTVAKEAFGDNITEEFVENNLEVFEEFAKGAEGSTEKIRAALTENLINSFDNTAADFSAKSAAIESAVAALDGLNFDIYGNADASQIFAELAAVIGSANEAAAAMEALGYSVTWEENGGINMQYFDPQSETMKSQWVPNYKAVVTDSAGNQASANRGGGGGGGGGGGEPEKWENPYDEFYNSIERINEELRTREKLERRYQKLLDSSNTKASDLVKNAQEQISSLEKERKMRQDLLAGRERQMADIEKEYSDLSSYAVYNETEQVIEIDWAKIESLDGSTDEELTSKIEEYISKLEEQQGLIEEEQDAIAEIEDSVKDIRDQGKDEYFDLEDQIREAIEGARQDEIDKLSSINDSINDTNSRLIDAMQSSIDKYRQDRENERTEEELSDKQRRLAYLQQDTSGANALDILALQEEIEQGQEDYTDSLIDQKITQLQEQNDKAAEQREQQIELMQAQLDHYIDSGQIWNDVYALMGQGIGPDGIIAGSELENLLKDAADFKGMSELQKMKWMEETENLVAEAIQWLAIGNSVSSLVSNGTLKEGNKITFTTADGQKVTGKIGKNGTVVADNGQVYEGVYQNYDGSYVTKEDFKVEKEKPSTPAPSQPAPAPEKPKKSYPHGKASEITRNVGWGSRGEDVKAVQYALNELGYRAGEVDGIFGQNTYNAVLKFQKDAKSKGWNPDIGSPDGIVGPRTRKAFAFKEYKTGGLADFTGPAWLDGTKSKPEYILNAEQTKSFFELIDVLGGLRSNTNQSSQITGDSIYDVDINVESIGNDYDVEQLANTIKRMINDDARYRNNNAINLQR